MKYIVEMSAETTVAMCIEAESEDQAIDEASRLANEGHGEFLNTYLDPLDFIEFNAFSTVDDIKKASDLGLENALAANRF